MQTFLENYLVPLIFLVIAVFSGLEIRKYMKNKKEKEAKTQAAPEADVIEVAEEKASGEE